MAIQNSNAAARAMARVPARPTLPGIASSATTPAVKPHDAIVRPEIIIVERLKGLSPMMAS